MVNYLIDEIKNMKGSFVGFGIDNEKIKDSISNNDNIHTCYLLEETGSSFNKKKLKLSFYKKSINIKKIKKFFKKKRIDNIICNYTTIKPFLKTFVRDSVYINKGKLYIYTNKKDYDDLVSKYKRYTEDIIIKKESNAYIIIIDNKNTKNNKLQDIKYYWIDTFNNIADILTSILVN